MNMTDSDMLSFILEKKQSLIKEGAEHLDLAIGSKYLCFTFMKNNKLHAIAINLDTHEEFETTEFKRVEEC